MSAPLVLRLTSGGACRHHGFSEERTEYLPSWPVRKLDSALPSSRADYGFRLLRIAWTWGLLGLLAFSNSTAASWAVVGEAPTIQS